MANEVQTLLAAGGALAVLGAAAFLWFVHRTLHPRRHRDVRSGLEGVAHPRDLGWPFEDVAFRGDGGVTIRGWLVPCEGPARAAVLLLHGHALNKTAMLRHARYLRPCGYDLLLMDLRHHGESDDGPFGLGYFEHRDVTAALGFLRGRPRTATCPVAAMGQSLGATTALLAAVEGAPLSAVVADSASADQAATLVHYAWLLYRIPAPLVRLGIRLAEWKLGMDFSRVVLKDRLRETAVPMLLIHGEADARVPVEYARLLAAAPSLARREVLIVPGAGHVGGHKVAPEAYERAVKGFLERELTPRASAPGNGTAPTCEWPGRSAAP